MSFSSDIKEELCRVINHDDCCMMAELTGFLITNCNIVKENNEFTLRMSTENSTAIRRVYSYFKKIYEVFKDKLIFLEVWYNNLPLAMSIDIIHNNKLIYLYGVSSSENRNLLGMYNMQWEAIKYCINNKIPKYDFGGVFCEENDIENKDFGLYNFKKGYCYNGFIDIIPDITFNFGKEVKND